MSRSTWIKRLCHTLKNSRRIPKGAPRVGCFRPRMEALEDRMLLSNFDLMVTLGGDNGDKSGIKTGQFSGDLRWCVNEANRLSQHDEDFSTITFPDPTMLGGNTITLSATNGELDIAKSTIIKGPGGIAFTISGGNDSRVWVHSHNVVNLPCG